VDWPASCLSSPTDGTWPLEGREGSSRFFAANSRFEDGSMDRAFAVAMAGLSLVNQRYPLTVLKPSLIAIFQQGSASALARSAGKIPSRPACAASLWCHIYLGWNTNSLRELIRTADAGSKEQGAQGVSESCQDTKFWIAVTRTSKSIMALRRSFHLCRQARLPACCAAYPVLLAAKPKSTLELSVPHVCSTDIGMSCSHSTTVLRPLKLIRVPCLCR
jgi:hypothetical protein